VKVHVFPYSPRKNTKAEILSRLDNRNQQEKKEFNRRIEERKAKIEQVVQEKTLQVREKFIGRTMEILVENTKNFTEISGHTENFLDVVIPKKNCCPNQIVAVKIIENTKEGILKGKII
jgi:threonylcarbamoyladenosine tRNA methylthiotransferase MtaB